MRAAAGESVGAATTAERKVSSAGSTTGFTTGQAARLSGCTESQLRYWRRTGLVDSSGSLSASGSPQYSFSDLVALRVVASLLEAGLSLRRVRRALKFLSASGDELASLQLVTDGETVWACHDDGEVLDALRSGQLALFVAVDRVAAEVEAEVVTFRDERARFVHGLETDSG